MITEIAHCGESFVRDRGSAEVVLDLSAVAGTLKVRNWEAGDRIQPLGMRGSRKVQDIFVDHKIPREMRDGVPLVVDDEKVLWVAGLVVSDRAKVTCDTRETVVIRVAPDTACPA